jgi:hypothetical protein
MRDTMVKAVVLGLAWLASASASASAFAAFAAFAAFSAAMLYSNLAGAGLQLILGCLS